jgi:glycosyltransferase involved in cell wall biosynthesis
MKRSKTHPLITVYIVSHNYGRFLENAVESVLQQTVDNWELLIINDNSKDNTDEVMKLYAKDPRIRLLKTNGIGLPAVCNLALKKAKGEYIIRLDGDDFFDDNILLILSNYLNRHPCFAMVFSDYYLIDEYDRVFAHERRESLNGKNYLLDNPANGACSLIRKKVLEEIGGYREDLKAQDGYDIWNKIIDKYKVANLNLPLFYYRRHEKNLTNNQDHIYRTRNRIKLDAVKDRIGAFYPVIAIIPCRARYDFMPNLWKCKIHNASLLEHCIKKCLKSELFNHIVVAADTEEVKKVIDLFKDQRILFFKRRTEDTFRSATLIPTLEEIINRLDPNYSGISVISYLQAPFVKTNTLEEAIGTLILNKVTSSMGVEELKGNLFKRSAHGLLPINPFPNISTDFNCIYREANTSLALLNKNIRTGSMLGPQIVHFPVNQNEYFFINSEQKLKIAEILLKENGNKTLWSNYRSADGFSSSSRKSAITD